MCQALIKQDPKCLPYPAQQPAISSVSFSVKVVWGFGFFVLPCQGQSLQFLSGILQPAVSVPDLAVPTTFANLCLYLYSARCLWWEVTTIEFTPPVMNAMSFQVLAAMQWMTSLHRLLTHQCLWLSIRTWLSHTHLFLMTKRLWANWNNVSWTSLRRLWPMFKCWW